MNCVIIDDDEMSRKAMIHLVSQMPLLELSAACSRVYDAVKVLNDKKIDLLLLDIEMPEMNGLEFLKGLKKQPMTIFVTSKKEYALEAFEFNVIDYLVKPVCLDRFFKAIYKAMDTINNINFSSDHFFVKENGALTRINSEDILWIEALGDYVIINTLEKKHTLHSTMKNIESKISSDKFVRVHRSFIVALNRINSIDDSIIVIDKKLIPIGAVYRENLIKRLVTL